MRATTIWMAFALTLGAFASGCSRSCNDDYNPADPDSCSYNPVYAGLVRERGANVAETSVRTGSSTSTIYLIVDPPDVERGSPVTMSVLNTSGVDVRVGPGVRLEWLGQRRRLASRCVLENTITAPAGEESEVFEMVPCAADDGKALPLGDYNFDLDVTAEDAEIPGGFSSGFRLAP